MRLLLVEDDKKIALFIKNGLKELGFAVDHTTNGEDGLHMSPTHQHFSGRLKCFNTIPVRWDLILATDQ